MAYGNVNAPGASGPELEAVKTIADRALDKANKVGTVPFYTCTVADATQAKTTNETLGTNLVNGAIFAVWFNRPNVATSPILTVEGKELPIMLAYMSRSFSPPNLTAGIHLFMAFNNNAVLLNPYTGL